MSKQKTEIKEISGPRIRRERWFDSKRGCIIAIGLCFAFIAVFVADIIMNGKWLSVVFIALYGLIIINRLKRLRTLNS